MIQLTAMTATRATDRLADWQTALRAENKRLAVYADGATRHPSWFTGHDHLPMIRAEAATM